jgi:hypothetical protein
MAAPPSADVDISSKRFRMAEIRTLAKSDDLGSMQQLMELVSSSKPIWERHLAMTLLRPAHRQVGIVTIQQLTRDPEIGIRIEAAVKWYQWTHTRASLEGLSKLQGQGANLRRAFQTGEKNGRPIYDSHAQQFFMASVRNTNRYTRLDGALGLVELGGQGPYKAGLHVLESELASADAKARLVVVKHLSVQYDEPAFARFLAAAAMDPDAHVKAAAKAILAH